MTERDRDGFATDPDKSGQFDDRGRFHDWQFALLTILLAAALIAMIWTR